jgi:hypothetical protein
VAPVRRRQVQADRVGSFLSKLQASDLMCTRTDCGEIVVIFIMRPSLQVL